MCGSEAAVANILMPPDGLCNGVPSLLHEEYRPYMRHTVETGYKKRFTTKPSAHFFLIFQ
jgi:hypothetical protein